MERNMWFLLRGEKFGYKFHRQKPIGEYIVDFYAPSLQLVIEIDGESHIENIEYDAKRTEFLNSLGLHVLRFTNLELAGDLEGPQENIRNWIGKVGEYNSVTPPCLPFSGEGQRYLINFGGDLFSRGGWKVGLESPFDPEEIIGTIELDDRFLACSAGTKRKWGNHHHLIDPHTGVSAQDVVATYIEGDSGMLVDGYATALSVMPWEYACSILESTPEIEGVLVRHDGSLYQSKGSRSEVFG